MKVISLICLVIVTIACNQSPTPTSSTSDNFVSKSKSKVTIDGVATEDVWKQAEWNEIGQVWLGENPTKEDFSGRYKIGWDNDFLYVLAEIIDDKLIDIHENGLDRYWDDDCLEIFIDENRSKGIHQYNHNAFAYHISLEGIVADIGLDSIPQYYQHLTSKRITTGTKSIWEVAMQIHPDTYQDGSNTKPITLHKGKKMGFAIAYCDNDTSAERENFIGSEVVEGEDKNRGWIDAGIFGEIILN